MSNHAQRILSAVLAFLSALSIAAAGDDKVEVEASDSIDFQAGLKVGAGRHAWISGAEHRMYHILLENGREDELKELLETGMWLSIIELDEFVRNEEADQKEKEAGRRILGKIVGHFVRNPRKIEKPENTDLAASVEKDVQKQIEDGEVSDEVQPVLEDVAAAAKEPLRELEGVFDSFLVQEYRRDLKIQAVFDRLAQAEQGGAEQPAAAPESKSEGKEKPKPESEGRSQ